MSDENTASSYLRYLPPVLWAGESPLLGQMLLVFEKILTGIDDGQEMPHGDHSHQAIEQVIARLDQLFDPWHTPPQFLDWLASWVDLSFPTIWDPQQRSTIQVWDEYLRRKAISQVVQIYRQRGLKQGLNQYLDLYTLADKRPRIAVDDGSRILFTRPQSGCFAQVSALFAHGPFANGNNVALDGLIAPRCIALAPDGSLLVGDSGTPSGWIPAMGKGVWRVFPSGQYMLSATSGKPQRIGPATVTFSDPAAIATDTSPTNWQFYVLDNALAAGANALYQIPSSDFTTANVLATKSALGLGYPIAMAFSNGHLLILDRGTSAPGGTPATPRVIDVQISPLQISTPRTLTQVIEPLSLAVLPNGNLLIGDGRQQNTALPADIVHVDRSNSANWIETLLLTAVPSGQNPLVAPVGVVRQDNTHLFVLDLGLKPYFPRLDPTLQSRPFLRNLAEAAVIYSVNLQPAPPQITRACEQGQLVHPTGIVQDARGTLYIADRGEYSDPQLAGEILRVWRASPHEFGVAVHFSSQRPTTLQDQRQIYQNISDIVDQEKPAHTVWTMVYGAPSPN